VTGRPPIPPDSWTLEASRARAAPSSGPPWPAELPTSRTARSGPGPSAGRRASLRLTVGDRAGNTATAASTVTVDTVPPQLAPADLQADVELAAGFTAAAARAGSRVPAPASASGAAGPQAAAAATEGPRVTLRWA
jgi:hypothetical protein